MNNNIVTLKTHPSIECNSNLLTRARNGPHKEFQKITNELSLHSESSISLFRASLFVIPVCRETRLLSFSVLRRGGDIDDSLKTQP